jgi:hypothetical protein
VFAQRRLTALSGDVTQVDAPRHVCGMDSCVYQAILWQKALSTEHRGTEAQRHARITGCTGVGRRRRHATMSSPLAALSLTSWLMETWCGAGCRTRGGKDASHGVHTAARRVLDLSSVSSMSDMSQRASSSGPIVAAGPLCRRAAQSSAASHRRQGAAEGRDASWKPMAKYFIPMRWWPCMPPCVSYATRRPLRLVPLSWPSFRANSAPY